MADCVAALGDGGQEVHRRAAEEAGDEAAAGGVIDLARGPELLDLALVEHEHQVGEGHGLDLVVGDVDAGGAELLVLLADVDADLGAQGGVEVAEGLVEEEELGASDDGAAHGDALALAAGEGAGEAVEQGGEAEHGGDLVDALVDDRGVGLAQLEAEGEVVADAEVGVERVALEHHGDVAVAGLEAGDLAIAEADLAAGDLLEAGEQAQEGRLAAAAGADQDREGAVGDGDVDALEHLRGAEALDDTAAGDGDHGGYFTSCWGTSSMPVTGARVRSRVPSLATV